MSTNIDLWKIFGAQLGEAWRQATELGGEMEYQLCFHFGSVEQKIAWQKSEKAQLRFDIIRTFVSQAYAEVGIPVTYIGDHVTLSDGTTLKYPQT
ncbi:MAG TPA: hypothetical protein VJI33_02395 [Candidatus Paceibacterota bacterium]